MLMGPTVIRSLRFHTTKTVHGPYGDEYGTFFSSCLTEGRVVGFHGREGWYIDGIGVHILEGKVLVQQVMGAEDERQISSDSFSVSNKFALALRKGEAEVISYNQRQKGRKEENEFSIIPNLIFSDLLI
jgi:Jacalin-like lectin domain